MAYDQTMPMKWEDEYWEVLAEAELEALLADVDFEDLDLDDIYGEVEEWTEADFGPYSLED